MTVFQRFQSLAVPYQMLNESGYNPFNVHWDEVLSPTEVRVRGRTLVLAGANNYLGMTYDPLCVQAGIDALRANGTGTTGSRIANGTFPQHSGLEAQLAEAYGVDCAMVFTTGFQANLGVISTVAGPEDVLLIDSDSHASIYDACKLSPAKIIRFRHNDPKDLDNRLARLADHPGHKFVVSEGIFSMLGDAAPLADIVDVKSRHGAYLILDEAHSLGVYGDRGLGLAEEEGLLDEMDIITGTFSKSLGAVGGFCTSNLPGFDVMRVVCRPYMFSASLPPSVIATVQEALKLMQERPELRRKLWDNVGILHTGLKQAGFELGPMPSPIVAVHVASRELAVMMWRELFLRGYYVNVAASPATPSGVNLLRCSVSAAHSREQMEGLVDAIIAVRRDMQVDLIPAAFAAQ